MQEKLKQEIEDFLNDYFEIDEYDCDDTINYLQDAVMLLEDVLKSIKMKEI
jgi:hypothetical protein